MGLYDTQDDKTRRVTLTKIYGGSRGPGAAIVGWEHAAPAKGERYAVFLGRGRVLRTSKVEALEEAFRGFLIKTSNSLYQLEYM